MAIPIGLNVALAGLLAKQRPRFPASETISQSAGLNKVAKPGYVRETADTPPPRAVRPRHDGEQMAALRDSIDDGVRGYVRRGSATQAHYEALMDAYRQMEAEIGAEADQSPLIRSLLALHAALSALEEAPGGRSASAVAVQAAQTVTEHLAAMTALVQAMRATADHNIAEDCAHINALLGTIATCNKDLARSCALDVDAAAPRARRDRALDALARLIDITYQSYASGLTTIDTTQGDVLVDPHRRHSLSHGATAPVAPWQARRGGDFAAIVWRARGEGERDLTATIRDGDIKANIVLRDRVLPEMQAQIDQIACQIQLLFNQVHNRGVALPEVAATLRGTRRFAVQSLVNQSISLAPGEDTVLVVYDSRGIAQATASLRAVMAGGAGGPPRAGGDPPWPVSALCDRMQAWLRDQSYAGAVNAQVGLDDAGRITIATGSSQHGLVFCDQIKGADGVRAGDVGVIFHAATPPVTSRNLLSIPGADRLAGASLDGNRVIAEGDRLTYALGDKTHAFVVRATTTGRDLLAWVVAIPGLEGSGFVNVGKVTRLRVANRTGLPLALVPAATAPSFQAMALTLPPPPSPDEIVAGFSHFLGLNDLFVSSLTRSRLESEILAPSTALGTARDLCLFDRHGQIGPRMTFMAGASLDDIAQSINQYSVLLTSRTVDGMAVSLDGPATLTLHKANGIVLCRIDLPEGVIGLDLLAARISAASTRLNAGVVATTGGGHLRVWDANGLTMDIEYGGAGAAALRAGLALSSRRIVAASLVEEGPGVRLRLCHLDGGECYLQAGTDSAGSNLLTDLGLGMTVCGTAGALAVAGTILSAPARLSRGAVGWNGELNRFVLAPGDTTVVARMIDALTQPGMIAAAGRQGGGRLSLLDYAAQVAAVLAQDLETTRSRLDYHLILNGLLENQLDAPALPDLDLEITGMTSLQQTCYVTSKVAAILRVMVDSLSPKARQGGGAHPPG